jgi:hypothetical protein
MMTDGEGKSKKILRPLPLVRPSADIADNSALWEIISSLAASGVRELRGPDRRRGVLSEGVTMPEKRIRVWVQRFKDRPNLILQWHDPFTGTRKSKSAETTIPAVAEMKGTELEYELNHGLHKEASRMSWDKFHELFEAEHFPGCREETRHVFQSAFDQFSRLYG